MNYQYWVIRYVPNVARGEFTNIGIVCGRDGGDWAAAFDSRFVRNHGGLSSDLRELSSWTRWFRRRIAAHSATTLNETDEVVGSGWIERLRARQANSVQFSAPAPIDVQSAAEGVNLLFPHLVEREGMRRKRTINRRAIRAEVRDTLVHELNFTVGRDLFVQPRAAIGKQRGVFDIARGRVSGETLTNVWAFNVATLEPLEREVQSWNFLVSRLRQDGATLNVGADRQLVVPPNVPVEVVFDPPTSSDDEWRTDIFEAALEAWSINNVAVNTLDDFVRRAEENNLATVG